ncbi:MAG: hypothetical protein D5R96_04975 [Methanocalculus sp. MSAO_Arc2]|nr:MAG: hypothetical protein D5R96_04975 [Methanocalculus sp. MSAO_Arc2]
MEVETIWELNQMGVESSFTRDRSISKTSRIFGKDRIAVPLLCRLAADPLPEVREAIARHTQALGSEDGAALATHLPDKDPVTLIESFLLTAGVPYDRRGDQEIVITKDFSQTTDQGFCTPDIALNYILGFLRGALPGWELAESVQSIRCRSGK